MYTRQGSVAVLQVTGSLLFRILLFYLIVMSFLLCSNNLTVTKSLPGLSVYLTSGAMASGDGGGSRPRVDCSGVSFRCELQTSWNAPEYVNLESLGVVELDTTVVPDVLGLRALYEDTKPIRCCLVGPRTVSLYRVPE